MNDWKEKAPLYRNPLIDDDFPDPSVIKVAGQGYFAYGTHDEFSPTLNNILVRRSDDLVNWSAATGALREPPVWARTCQRFWCTQVVQVGEEFRLYYAAEPDTKDGMCLAMATSRQPFDFTDSGHPLSQVPGSTYQMIDPCFFADPLSGRHFLYYGSAHEPIRVVELGPDGKTFLGEPKPILYPCTGRFHRLREGSFVTYQAGNGRYFLWVAGDNTWEENAYAISVYWSESPTSLFQPVPGDEPVVRPNEKWDAPGQNCVIEDEAGRQWIIYHAVDTHDRYIPGTRIFQRKMCMDPILFNAEGWPFIEGGSPSFASRPIPVTAITGA